MNRVQVFLEGDIIPAGLDVANRRGIYFSFSKPRRTKEPLVAGLAAFQHYWDKAVADERFDRAINERGEDGLPTAAASKAIGEMFDRDFPHGTICDCVDCLKRQIDRLQRDLLAKTRESLRYLDDKRHAVQAHEYAKAGLVEAVAELEDRQKSLKQVIKDRDRLFEERNKLARQMADVRDEAAAALQEAAYAREEKAEIVSERDELTEKIYQLEHMLGAIWLYVKWRYVTKQLTTEEKELWADAVDKFGDPDDRGPKAERWWRE
jgi:DNA repair exonuclease SbcCD ATPase subunit